MARKEETENGKRTHGSKEIVSKVTKLVALAQSDNEEEARTAAMQAVRLMNEHKLTCVPQAELDSAMKFVEGARELARQTKEEGQKKMMIGAALGFLAAKRF